MRPARSCTSWLLGEDRLPTCAGPRCGRRFSGAQPTNPRVVNPQISESLDRLITEMLSKEAAKRPSVCD